MLIINTNWLNDFIGDICMVKNDGELYYELLSVKVPEVLEKDWNINFKNSKEKEIAIRIFEWKYGPQDMFSDMSLDAWQDETIVKFNKGYFNGKISFSLDWEKVSIFKLMINIITFIVGDKKDIKTYIGSVLSISDIFKTAVNVHMIENGHHRCAFLKIIEISKNNPNNPVDIDEIDRLCNEDGSCSYSDIFECSKYDAHEQSCMVRKEQIVDIVKYLEKKNVIHSNDKKNYYIC